MKSTTDVWFAAYLLMRGVKIAKRTIIERGKVRCLFELSEEDWEKHKLDFLHSELCNFKNFIAQIKDLAF